MIQPGVTEGSEMQTQSHLFTVRVWIEERPDGKKEWRGKVQHVVTGSVRYFSDWSTLITYLKKTTQEAS